MADFIFYLVEGINPEPWEAPTASVGRKGKGYYVHMHKNEGQRAYQEGFADAFKEQNPDWQYFDQSVELAFFFWRHQDMAESRAKAADVTNLQKSTEDALQGILYPNDTLVIKATSMIVEQTQDTEPRVLVCIRYAEPVDPLIVELADSMHKELPKSQPNLRVVPDVF